MKKHFCLIFFPTIQNISLESKKTLWSTHGSAHGAADLEIEKCGIFCTKCHLRAFWEPNFMDPLCNKQCFFYFFASVKKNRPEKISPPSGAILVPKSSFRIRFSCFFSILARRRRKNCSFFTQKRKILSKCNDFSENPTFFSLHQV